MNINKVLIRDSIRKLLKFRHNYRWHFGKQLRNSNMQQLILSTPTATESSVSCFFLDATEEKMTMEIKKLPITFTGTGDLFTSLFLSWMYKTNGTLKESLEKTIASLQAVIKRTAEGLEGEYKIMW